MAKKDKPKKPIVIKDCGGKKKGKGCNSWGGSTYGRIYISIAA